MADRIVINTGPILALARADALEIPARMPMKFLCPTEVRRELDDGTKAGYLPVHPTWLEVVPLAAPLNALGRAALDPGEAAVIQLALEQGIEGVCLDDRKGRRAALAAGLRVTGSLGLWVRAKMLGLVPAVVIGLGLVVAVFVAYVLRLVLGALVGGGVAVVDGFERRALGDA
jgi:predicted nucleic acid-binding protein